MVIDYRLSFGGAKPLSECKFCGCHVDKNGYCPTCVSSYQRTTYGYDIPEPLTSETLTPKRWKDITLIKKSGKAAGKSQHEINVEVFNYAYHACFPADSGPSPYLDICDIPTAATDVYVGGGYFQDCPVCGQNTYDSSYCSSCTDAYSNTRNSGDVPAPLTKRILNVEHWIDICRIKKEGQAAGKPPEEINLLLSEYAKFAIAKMQAEINQAAIPPIPSALINYLQKTTTPDPAEIQPSSRTNQNVTTESPSQPTQFQQSYRKIIDHFKLNQCYICYKWYWTKSAADRCCKEAKKNVPPPMLGRRIPRFLLLRYIVSLIRAPSAREREILTVFGATIAKGVAR